MSSASKVRRLPVIEVPFVERLRFGRMDDVRGALIPSGMELRKKLTMQQILIDDVTNVR
jgi:hypothetical protein